MNSPIRRLVAQGRSVFAISWHNPRAGMRDTSLDDYRTLGPMAAPDAVRAVVGRAKVHGVGYCLGGTLLAITAAAMARDGDHRLASLTLLSAETDFSQAGELELFITEDQINFLGDVMEDQGYLAAPQMAGAFQMLRANDLVWSRTIHQYWLGERDAPNDLIAWNADGTRLPADAHRVSAPPVPEERACRGRVRGRGPPGGARRQPSAGFVVGTERDHIAPWRSVFKLHGLNDGALTFVLTSGGHNAGIVSEPGHAGRHFRIRTRAAAAPPPGPDEWQRETPSRGGSWWPQRAAWLDARTDVRFAPPGMGAPGYEPLGDAPGTYVLER